LIVVTNKIWNPQSILLNLYTESGVRPSLGADPGTGHVPSRLVPLLLPKTHPVNPHRPLKICWFGCLCWLLMIANPSKLQILAFVTLRIRKVNNKLPLLPWI